MYCNSNVCKNKTIYSANKLDSLPLQYNCILLLKNHLLPPLILPSWLQSKKKSNDYATGK